MLKTKRVIIATIFGLIFGIVCMLLAGSNQDLTIGIKWSILLSRGLLGFLIGISALRMAWWIHGIVLGIIASLPMAVAITDTTPAIWTLVMGIVYGFLIELITSIIFKAKPLKSEQLTE